MAKIAMILSCMTLLSCQALPPERDINEQERAIQAARGFINAFIAQDPEAVLSYSSVPFWGDGDLLASHAEIKQDIEPQLRREKSAFAITGARFYSADDLAFLWPDLAAKLQKKAFPSGSHAVVVAVAEPDDPSGEKLVVLVRKESDGQWRVSGIDD
jgi:hypothetical protein